MLIFLAAVAAFSLTLLIPDAALAWGPGVHLAAGNFILANADLLPPALGQLLPSFRDAFLYGSLSADIFVGKGSKVRAGHSHDWETGLAMLRADRGPELRAYAYGYLSHLAADVVAHNFYVPNELAGTAPSAGKLSHVYVEMQADRRVCGSIRQARNLFTAPSGAADKLLLASTGKNRPFFLLRKQVFRTGLELSDRPALARLMSSARDLVCPTRDPRYFERMLDVTLRTVLDFLNDPEGCPALAFDPMGIRRLKHVKRMKRREMFVGRDKPVGRIFPLDPGLDCLPSLGSELRPSRYVRAEAQAAAPWAADLTSD